MADHLANSNNDWSRLKIRSYGAKDELGKQSRKSFTYLSFEAFVSSATYPIHRLEITVEIRAEQEGPPNGSVCNILEQTQSG